MEFRYRILDWSLTIEHALNAILKLQFRITEDSTKTLSHRSSALSFKNKVDLLYDFSKIEKESYTELLCFMELRNQFMHNQSAGNIKIAVDRIDKLKYMISLSEQAKEAFTTNTPEHQQIAALEISAINLYGKILNTLSKVGDMISLEIEKEINSRTSVQMEKVKDDYIKLILDSIDEVSNMFDTAFELKEGDPHYGKVRDVVLKLILDKINKYNEAK